MLSESDARAIARTLLGHTTASDAEVSLETVEDGNLRFAAGAFTTSGRREDTTASVTVWIEGRKGTCSTNELDEAALRAAVREAEQIAAVSPVDKEYVPTLGPQEYKPVAAWSDATAGLSPAARARAVSEVIAACEKEKVVGAGFHETEAVAELYASRNGSVAFHRSTLARLSVTARTAGGDGSGYFNRNHFDLARLDTARIAGEAVRKALASRDPRPMDPGVYTVILEPQAMADLVGLLRVPRFGFDARNADEGRSAFSAPGGKTKLGEPIFDERLNVLSDPWRAELPGFSFVPSGLPARPFHFVRNGVLETLVYSRHWAREKQKEPTPGPVNFIVESSGPRASMEEMIRATRKGLLVSRFWYLRPVDPRTALFTGLTRDGVWLVEDGRVKHPVRNLRFNQGILALLAPGNVEMIGPSERVGGSEGGSPMMMPPLKAKAFHFTSVSEAV